MKCTKCGNEKTLLPETMIGTPIYHCKHCTDAINKAKEQLELAKRNKYLNVARINSGISKRLAGLTFDSFKTQCLNAANVKQSCIDYVTKIKNKELTGSLSLIGKCGTGKTLIAAAMVEELGYDDYTCRIRTLSGIVLELKESWKRDSTVSESELIQFYTNQVDVLIIDEVGVSRGTDTENMLLFSIIDGRYNNMLPTVLISNLQIAEFKEAVGERIIDRLREDGGKVLAFGWDSMRK